MGLLKTQRAVVFWSAEKEPEKPSVPWGSHLSVLAIVWWEPRPRPPLHRPISGPDETTPARAETAGGGRGLVVLAAARSTRRYTGLASTRSTQPRAPCCPRTAAVPRTTVKFGPMTVGSSQYRSCGALLSGTEGTGDRTKGTDARTRAHARTQPRARASDRATGTHARAARDLSTRQARARVRPSVPRRPADRTGHRIRGRRRDTWQLLR